MISFLIPIYNFNVTDLVLDINKQSIKLNIEFEILLVDDFSTKYKSENQKLKTLKSVRYIELSENYGRSKIRNYLGQIASFENLVFLDCDSAIVSDDFVKNYLNCVKKSIIVYGGTVYQKQKPSKELYLHWLYGIKREVRPLTERKKYPNKGFHTNNFMIKKSFFLQIQFNEKIKGYGHEDTLFGYELKKKKVQIQHIINPVEHLGLETTDDFIRKTKIGLDNLNRLVELFPNEKKLFEDIKLLNSFFIIKKFYFCSFFKITYIVFNKLIIRNLRGKSPLLKFLDLYKISYLCYTNK